ncbi:MAG: hypothetical protein KA533_06965 [Sphingobium sp.]|nr:hypothetical protein [Sphingobium sp.]MBP6111675.1 hypothetical protein [Sphingobium sp.]MBP8670751.1 hypothetical protein [Sphingobium sp.]
MEEVERIKNVSQRFSEHYRDIRKHLVSEVSSDNRWFTASLFALNAGGLATMASQDILVGNDRWIGILFWIGIVLAFGYVHYSRQMTTSFIKVIDEIELCYVLSAATGKLDETRLAALETKRDQLTTKFSSFFSAGSLIAFSSGIFAFAVLK